MNLSTTYLGLELRTPLVPSASPLSRNLDNLKQMEDAGASAVVLHSIFEEQIRYDTHTLGHRFGRKEQGDAEVLSYFPTSNQFPCTPDRYLENLARAKRTLGIPVIASLCGGTFGRWTTFGQDLEQAGADALELNIYAIPTDPDIAAEDIEQSYLTMLVSLRHQLKIPLSIKLSPFFTNFSRFARQLDSIGMDGLVLFNRFYQPDVSLESLEFTPSIDLSTPGDFRLPLHWVAMLHGRINASLAATGGIHRGADALKVIMAGADVAMLCSALLRHGINHLAAIEDEMREWLEKYECESIANLKGRMNQKNYLDPGAFERAQYMRAITDNRAIIPAG